MNLLPDSCVEHLPDIADYNDLDLQLNPLGLYWKRWPELRNTRFFLGLGDGACANVGSKCTLPSRIACTIGTSAATRICLPLSIHSNTSFTLGTGLFCYRVDKFTVLIGGALTDGGSVVEWIIKLLRLSTIEFEECLLEVKTVLELGYIRATDATRRESLSIVPFFSGERSTGFRSHATGTIHGITRDTSAVHLIKACLEGVTLRLSAIIRLIQSVVDQLQPEREQLCGDDDCVKIVCSGKALELNSVWRQILADATCLPVFFDEDTNEGTSRGIARMVLFASSVRDGAIWESGHQELVSRNPLSLILPNQSSQPYWDKATGSQERLIQSIAPLYDL